MPAERGRAALLDRRHDLELPQAHMSGIGPAPVGPMAMKNVGDLQPRAAHGRPATPRAAASPRSMMRAGRAGCPDRDIGDAGVKCRSVELGVAERTRAIMLTFYVIEVESSAARDAMLTNDAALSAR